MNEEIFAIALTKRLASNSFSPGHLQKAIPPHLEHGFEMQRYLRSAFLRKSNNNRTLRLVYILRRRLTVNDLFVDSVLLLLFISRVKLVPKSIPALSFRPSTPSSLSPAIGTLGHRLPLALRPQDQYCDNPLVLVRSEPMAGIKLLAAAWGGSIGDGGGVGVTGLGGCQCRLDREIAAGKNSWATEAVSFSRADCESGVTRGRSTFCVLQLASRICYCSN